MKHYMKRVLAMLCVAACLFSLTACSKAADTAGETIDPQTAAIIMQSTEGLMQNLTAVSEAEADELVAQLNKSKDTVLANGVSTWVNVMGDTGAYVSVLSSSAEENEDGTYVGVVYAQFENRNVEFKTFYEVENQSLVPTSISFAPEYTTGENMAKAAMNTLMGMGTVFLVLIFISLLISCFKFIKVFEDRMKAKEAAAAPAPAPAPVAAPVVEEEELVDDLELVAVITAAIAAATNSSTDGLVVRSIKRAPGAKWKRA